MLRVLARILLAAVAAFIVAWGVYLIVEPPEAGRWIGALLVALGAACVLPAFSRRRALR
jgi:drug/metabolite transporter (DMT)-like permease